MNVLHINSYFSTSPLYDHLYQKQLEMGVQLNVYVPISHEYPEDRLASRFPYVDNVRLYNHRDRYIFPLKHKKILQDLERRYPWHLCDVIHAHSLFSNGWLAQQMSHRHRIPYIVAVRNTDIRTFFAYMPWMRTKGLQILADAQRIVFISKNAYEEVLRKYIPADFKAAFQAKTTIIPNGIDDFWLKNKARDPHICSHRPLRIVSTGKVMGLKRFPQLAKMLESYYQEVGPVELHIVGPNWNPQIMNRLKASPLVTYHGPMAKEALKTFYAEMDIFALLSSPETFGLVYVEAMSQGLPLIYTKGEGFDGFFPNQFVGISVDKTDRAGLTQALAYLVHHYEEMSYNALNSVSDFNWQAISRKYMRMYRAIITEANNE